MFIVDTFCCFVCLQVNADLKKLLVASIGDDLHHKVDALVRYKATKSVWCHHHTNGSSIPYCQLHYEFTPMILTELYVNMCWHSMLIPWY